jgi:serine/threonine protein kinase
MTWTATVGAELGGRYALEAKIGEGGMGEVWRARHIALETLFAIKFLSGTLTSNDELKARFLVEAKVTAQIKTRHAVQVFDYGLTDDGQPYLVMELLNGEPLSACIERLGHLDFESTARIMTDAAKALAKAHALHIVHRDFKPDNVILAKTDEHDAEVKVLDFGIAKLLGSLDEVRPTEEDWKEISGKALSSLTRTGKLVGTPHYMSPEQIAMRADIGPPADIWAFGVVAYECLTGRMPFNGKNLVSLFSAIQMGRMEPANGVIPGLSAFDDWFRIACSPKPEDRFQDIHVAAAKLAEVLAPSIAAQRATGFHPDSTSIRIASGRPSMAMNNTLVASSSVVEVLAKKRGPTMWMLGIAAIALFGGGYVVVSSRSTPKDTITPINAAPHASVPSEALSALVLPPRATADDAIPVTQLPVEAHDAGTHASIVSTTRTTHSDKTDKPPQAIDTSPQKPASSASTPAKTGAPSPFTLPPLGI